MSEDEKGTRTAPGDAQLPEQVIERHVAKDKERGTPSSERRRGDGEKKGEAAEGSVKDFVVRFRSFPPPTSSLAKWVRSAFSVTRSAWTSFYMSSR